MPGKSVGCDVPRFVQILEGFVVCINHIEEVTASNHSVIVFNFFIPAFLKATKTTKDTTLEDTIGT